MTYHTTNRLQTNDMTSLILNVPLLTEQLFFGGDRQPTIHKKQEKTHLWR